MPTLKEIKGRIGSVKSTLKITSAMKLVSSAKLRKAQVAIEAMRPYEEALQGILASLRDSSTQDDGFVLERPVLEGSSTTEASSVLGKTAIVAMASNSSLCGGFNSNIIAKVRGERHPGDVVFSVGRPVTVDEARAILDNNLSALQASWQRYGENAPLFEAMQCALAWDTIYDATNDRVISPVSRLWSIRSGGYILFCWDNYFAGYMASLECPALGYANLAAITSEQTPAGLVPNFAKGTGNRSLDRSQPPVGSRMVLESYRLHGDQWLLEMLYPALLRWNEWFAGHRMENSGALCWGSDPRLEDFGDYWDTTGVNDTFGGALESGLDNSPMYDGVPFDKERHVMRQADVGLTGLYILDCESLIEMAHILGRTGDISALSDRLQKARRGLDTLWDEENGFYYNRRTDTGEFSRHIGPTCFYALFDSALPRERVRRMMEEHYWNPDEFAGEYILPSIARNDPGYRDQDYWRGRVWAPLNFLVYMGLRRHGLAKECADLAQKSAGLLMREWTEHGHIHENYNADTGSGCDVANSDKFYHWGALLSLVALIEAGSVPTFDPPSGKGERT